MASYYEPIIQLTVDIVKHGKSVVAYSPALDISTTGKNEAEARRRFSELVELFFEELQDKNTTQQALTELGFRSF